MRVVGWRLALVLFFAVPGPSGAQGIEPLDCGSALPDCLIAEARALAEDARRASHRDEILFSVAASLAELGRPEEALDIAAGIENARTLAEALGEIAIATARDGYFARSYDIALSIVDARARSARVMALETLAGYQGAAGRIDAAFDTVVAIDNPFRRSEAQANIALAVARSGEIDAAILAASRIATGYWFTSDQHQLKIASGLVSRSGEFDHFWFYEAMVGIAGIQARSGDIRGALQTARSIPDMGGRSRAQARVAAIQAGTGDIAGALDTARRIEAPYGDLDAVVAVAEAQAAAGDFDRALDLARQIERAYGDADALVAVAVEQARQGQVAQSLETTAGIASLESRTSALAGVSLALAQGGTLDPALEAAAQIPEAGDRADAIRDIALVLAGAGKVEEALEVAARFGGRRGSDEIVVAVALAQAEDKDISGAVRTALGLGDEMYRAIALAGIAPFAR